MRRLLVNGAAGCERHRPHGDRGNGAFGESDIEGKAAVGSGESAGKQASFNRGGRRRAGSRPGPRIFYLPQLPNQGVNPRRLLFESVPDSLLDCLTAQQIANIFK